MQGAVKKSSIANNGDVISVNISRITYVESGATGFELVFASFLRVGRRSRLALRPRVTSLVQRARHRPQRYLRCAILTFPLLVGFLRTASYRSYFKFLRL